MNAYDTGKTDGVHFLREWKEGLSFWTDEKVAELASAKAQRAFTQRTAQQRYQQGFVESVQRCQQGLHGTEPGAMSIHHAFIVVHIRDAVWNGEINQMNTQQVAGRFGCPLPIARQALLGIIHGKSGDVRFVPNAERGSGVLVQSGATFDYSPMGIDGNGAKENDPKHYVWFLS